MLQDPKGTWKWTLIVVGCLLVASCVTVTGVKWARQDRGLLFPHDKHVEDMDCTDCHDHSGPDRALPDHNTCEICHEIDVSAATPEDCGMCHKDEEQTVKPWESQLTTEILFKHTPHINKELECTVCHEGPGKAVLTKGCMTELCMDCHEKQGVESLLECANCHTTMNEDVVPTHRSGRRIAHDSLGTWKRLHGQEALIDEAYCALCHDTPNECDSCHRQEQPQSHTLSWRKKTHGRYANFDRAKCAVCHEEDLCQRCHQNNKPTSHRAGYGGSLNQHCISCHYPPGDKNCSVCHEAIEHPTAVPSVHGGGVFPQDCAQCHPRGNPFQAPHPTNSTVDCQVCHQ